MSFAMAASIPDLLAPVSSSLSPEPPMLQLDLPDPERDDISTMEFLAQLEQAWACLLYTSPSPRDRQKSRMPSSA